MSALLAKCKFKNISLNRCRLIALGTAALCVSAATAQCSSRQCASQCPESKMIAITVLILFSSTFNVLPF